jgi:hypothetical protein
MAERVSLPSVYVNNELVQIMPNSVSYTDGFGLSKVDAQSAGASVVTPVFSQDAETFLSTIKFELYNTPEALNLARSWRSRFSDNSIYIDFNDPNTNETVTCAQCAVTNDVEYELKATGKVSLEFKGTAVT